MTFSKSLIVAAGSVLLAAGCGSVELSRLNPWAEVTERSRIPSDATVYACASGKQLVVRYPEGGKSVMIILPEREFRLDLAPAGGGNFTNGRASFSTRDGEITLIEGNETLFSGCKKPAS